MSWPVPKGKYGYGRCPECHKRFAKNNGSHKVCSQRCRDARAVKVKAKWYERTQRQKQRAPARPLHGPNAHPFLVVFREIRFQIEETPRAERPAKRVELLQRVAQERGDRFAAVIAFALREHDPEVIKARYHTPRPRRIA
jgi:hypothetical protein